MHDFAHGAMKPPQLEESAQRLGWKLDDLNGILRQGVSHSKKSLINRSLLFALALVSLDCLIVAHYQADVALTLIRATPPLTLLAGVFLNLAPLFLPLWAVARFASGVQLCAVERTAEGISAIAASLLWLGACLFLAPATMIPSLWTFFGIILIGASYYLFRQSQGVRSAFWAIVGVVGLILGLGGTQNIFSLTWGDDLSALKTAAARPFAAPERLSWRGADGPKLGYVLQEGPEWAVILTEKDRKIVIRTKSDLIGRQTCAHSDRSSGPPQLPLVDPIEPMRCE